MWDIEVDVACIGGGIGTLAAAIVAVDAGADVVTATPSGEPAGTSSSVAVQHRVDGFLRSWSYLDLDRETDEYFTAMSEDLASLGERSDSAPLTVRKVHPMATVSGTVETFFGSRLSEWNAQCLASPYGMLYSSVSGRQTTPMRGSDGRSLEVAPIGTIDASELTNTNAVSDWVLGQARIRNLDVRESSPLERIVFEHGRVVGAVLATPEGPLAVKVRHGVNVTSGDVMADIGPLAVPADAEGLQVCIVGQYASRFLRLEVLDTVAAESAVRPMCGASGRQLRDGMREARSLPSGAWRCGKPR